MIFMYPSKDFLLSRASGTPGFMVPNLNPSVVIVQPGLSPEACNAIDAYMMELEEYQFTGCGAHQTRELPSNKGINVFTKMEDVVRQVNDAVFKFDLNEGRWVWHQSYAEGGNYQLHKDTSYGQSRKLTAILQLSPSDAYDGGSLEIIPYPDKFVAPRDQGTIVVFPSWIPHQVKRIFSGNRSSINMGLFGPPFR